MKVLLIFLVILLGPAFMAGSALAGSEASPGAAVQPAMHALGSELSDLERFVLSEAEFLKPTNAAAIERLLGEMRDHVAGLDKADGPFAKKPALRDDLHLLHQQVDRAVMAFAHGSKPAARAWVQGSLGLCVSCHLAQNTPLSFPSPVQTTVSANGLGGSPLEKADFLFAIRQFEEGKAQFEKVVAGYPDNQASRAQLQHALGSLALYYVRVKEDPEDASKYFRTVSKKRWLSDLDQKEFRSWSRYFSDWAKERKKGGVAPKTDAEFLAEAKRVLGSDTLQTTGEGHDDLYVRRLRASQLLHEALLAGGPEHDAAKGEAVYDLGMVYERLGAALFFRFGELYLRCCVEEYPASLAGQRCYGGLEAVLREEYAGRPGAGIPVDEQKEMDRLKKIAF